MRLGIPPPQPASQMSGRRIGPYELFEELGRGGMGEVYRARRADGQYEQQVAVKLIRGGHEGGVLLQRFWTERQILATLDHPNIARLLDGGATSDGLPYLVMELIEGTNICDYCDAHRLGVAARLDLFLQVCSAVQYAHQRLIVHRDIKPTNILVTAEGVPKLLDFGIAKILAPSSETELTLSRPMTLAYASPEQIRGETVTTASDVYSLGVVLYRLLAGRSPYRINATSPGGLYRAIEEDAPVRPSAVIGLLPADHGERAERELTAEELSTRRDSSVAKLAKRLRGDLDDIVLKALRKEPDRRYASVDQLSQDVERHLNGFPVSARQGTWTYHAEKFVRRHKVGLAAAVVVGLVTAAGIAATLVEARIAAANGRRAEQRFEQIRKLANAMVFDVHDAIEMLPGATKPRELIVRLGLQYLDELSRDGSADASLQLQLATGYIKLGRTQGDPNEPNLGDRAGAAASFRKAVAIVDQVRAREPNNPLAGIWLSQALNGLAHVSESSSERWAVQARSLELRRTYALLHPTDDVAQRAFATALFQNGLNYLDDHRYSEAVAPFRQALGIFQEIDRRVPNDKDDRNVALCYKRLAALSLHQGDLEAALRGYTLARAIDERLVAKYPLNAQATGDLGYDLNDLAMTLQRLKRWPDAADVYDKVIALRRNAYDADVNDDRARRALASSLSSRAVLTGEFLHTPAAAIPLLREASRLWSLDRDRIEPQRGEAEFELAWDYQQMDRPPEAAAHRAAALAIFSEADRRNLLPPNDRAMLDKLRGQANPPATR
jgi:non-specific serine/threonine protein kinase/serine/threonine-protein kinase